MSPRAKTTVEECVALDARALAPAGCFEPGRKDALLPLRRGNRDIASLQVAVYEDGLRLEYGVPSSREVKTRLGYVLSVVRTPALNNGERVWFSCPGCHKRVGTLYLPPGKNTFLCRSCHHLTYASQKKRLDIWQKLKAEMPKLEEDLRNPRLGVERQLKAAERIEELRAQAESAVAQNMELLMKFLPPALRSLLLDVGTQRAEPVPRPPASAPCAKRPRGRPKEKRPYQRHKPFPLGERRTAAEAFCVKCRAYREPTDWALVTFKNGRPALQGRCPSCGSKVARIITARGAALLAGAPAKPTGGAELFGFTPLSGDTR